jgi:mevalonate kinase
MAVGTGKAKTIFLGEHFVVYGCKAIGFGLDKKIEVEINRSSCFEICFGADEKIKEALEFFKNSLGVKNFKINIRNSEIPVASGLGSSAAFNVAAIRALSGEFDLGLADRQVCDLAFGAEKIFHGNPSGIDNTLSTFGGSIVFQKRPGNNLIEPLQIGSPLHLVMAHSGVKSGTKNMIDKVRAFKDENETVFSDILNAELIIVEQAITSVREGDLKKLGALMNANHKFLSTIGVSRIENEKIISISREYGALGTKVVGAGGGGFCAALMENRGSALALMNALKKQYQCFYNLVPAT